ncbi:MAG: hypothetical protein H6Q54_708 [Deltaproteobacteria bacterium]|jgi:hypothetical protein|nr:hypothetical protein [Deltaproteobacteria bacterium]MBS1232420.1 hypothetical protein [Nitrospirota bacterium]
MKRNLLFVTYREDDFGDGLSYALDLAKMMDKGIAILLVHKKKLSKRFEDLMTAITFAEANEHETAREEMQGSGSAGSGNELQHLLREKCNHSGISTSIYSAVNDTGSALKDFLKKNNNVEMVLLSPSITDNGNMTSRELKQLVRTASRPIITMAKHAHVA